jgi:exopolysaccharide biosynthesis polyprenyl glycosylphosphotransferase
MDTSISGMGPSPAEQTSVRHMHRIPAQGTATTSGSTPGIAALEPGIPVPQLGCSRVADGVDVSAPAYRRSATRRPPRGSRHRRTRLEAPLALQLLAILGSGVAAAVAVDAGTVSSVTVLVLCLVCGAQARGTAIRPDPPRSGRMVPALAVPLAVVGTFLAFSGAATGSIRDAAAIIASCAFVDAACTFVRRRLGRATRVLVVGADTSASAVALRWADRERVDLTGVLLLQHEGSRAPAGRREVRAIDTVDEVVAWVHRWEADMVILVPGPGITSGVVRRLGWLLERTPAALAISGVLDSVAPHRIDLTRVADTTVMRLRPSRPSASTRALKWSLDRVLGLLLLVLSLPVLLLLWAWVKLDSPGPGFFAQTRVGQHGRTFTMFKLRTMRWDAEDLRESLAGLDEGHGPLFKMSRDPRVTTPGRLLRKFSLDELPQLLNVVCGQMSLVGPRPALPEEVSSYEDHVLRRLAVRPGITGLWQVSGRSDLTWERSVELDLLYTDNYRLRDDLLIGLRTVEAVIRPRGAY